MSINVEVPYQNFVGLDGNPLNNGQIFLGGVGTDPTVIANRIPVYWDAALSIPAAQPLATINGYIYRSGTPARAYTATDYAMTVWDQSNVLVYYSDRQNVIDSSVDSTSVFRYMTAAQIADVKAGTLLLDVAGPINTALLAQEVVTLPTGHYRTNSPIIMRGYNKLIGAGRLNTYLTQSTSGGTVIQMLSGSYDAKVQSMSIERSVTATAAAIGIDVRFQTDGISLADLFIKRQGVGCLLGPTGYSTMTDCWVDTNQFHGVMLSNQYVPNACQWYMTRVISAQNGGNGFHVEGFAGQGSMSVGGFNFCQTYANTGRSLYVKGTGSSPVASIRMSDCFLGDSGEGEIYLDSYGDNHRILNTFFETAGVSNTGPGVVNPPTHRGIGIEITANNNFVSIIGCIVSNMSYGGISSDAPNTQISGCQITNNGLASVSGQRYGIRTNNSGGLTSITSNVIGNVAGTQQSYGLQYSNDNLLMVGNTFNSNGIAAISGVTLTFSQVSGNLPKSINF